MLAGRLRELEQAAVVRRRSLPPPAASRVYELTERGLELEPVILELGRWGSRAPFPGGDAGIGADAVAIALKTLFSPAAAGGLEASYALLLGADGFRVRMAGGRLELARGEAVGPDALIEARPGTLAALLWHGLPADHAERTGELRIEGSRRAATRFLRLFPLPADRYSAGA